LNGKERRQDYGKGSLWFTVSWNEVYKNWWISSKVWLFCSLFEHSIKILLNYVLNKIYFSNIYHFSCLLVLNAIHK
jgi:hypothetical protein